MIGKVTLAVAVTLLLSVAVVGGLTLADNQGEFAETQRQRSNEANVARWNALGEFYAKLGAAENISASAIEAGVARWVAMGEFYSRLAETHLQRANEANVARWKALGEFYAKSSAAENIPAQAVDAGVGRWVAMGEFYSRLAETRRQRSNEADVARWVAKGEFYLKHAEAEGAFWAK